nr:hypothetical protein [Tissierella sp.]
MKTMFRAILTIININTSKKINGFLYFLKNIPLVKRLFKNVNYSFIGFKKFLSITGVLSSMIWGPILFGVFFYAAIYFPSSIDWVKGDRLNSVMFFIFMFFFLFKFTGSELMDPDEETFIVVKQLKMNPRVYSISQTIWKRTRELFSRSIVLALIFSLLLKKEWISGVQIALAITMFSIIMEAAHLYLYKKTGFSINRLNKTRVAVILLGGALTYALVILTEIPRILNLFSILSNLFVTIGFIILGIVAFIYLYKYDRYWDIINEANKLETFMEIKEAVKDIDFQQVRLQEKDFDDKDLKENEHSSKEGYDYLNYIFFKRHKRVVYKPMLIKSALIAAIFIILFIVDKFFISGVGKDITQEFIEGYTVLIFIMYALSNSTSIIKSLFHNCDRSLLRYGFYKEGDALLKMFFLRLRQILLSNIIPAIVLCIGLVAMVYIYLPGRMIQTLPMVVSTLLLSVTFSVHYMFIYYLLQPFSTDLQIKSPLYNAISFGVYGICYGFIGLGVSAMKVLPYIAGFAVVYISLAIVLVYKKAPKTFRVK